MSQPQSVDPEDASVLALTGQLCTKLRINFVPVAVVWVGTLGHPTHLPSDQAFFVTKGAKRGRVLVPSGAKGRLEPADWNFILLSSLIYRFKPEFRRVWQILSRLIWGAFIVSFLSIPIFLLDALLRTQDLDLATGAFVFTSALAFMLVAWYLSVRYYIIHVLRVLHLRADILAARMIDRDQSVQTLQKIDAMRIEDLVERREQNPSIWRRRRASSWPTIKERLNNLNRIPQDVRT